jgi:plasmid segregation protein ParM
MDQGSSNYTPTTRKPLVVAVDDGYARIKVCTPERRGPYGNWSDIPTVREFGTVVTRGRGATFDGSGEVTECWMADGEQYTVNADLQGDNIATDDFHWSTVNRVLINHYLATCGLSDVNIDLLVVGMPMSQFFTPSGKRSDAVKRKIDNLLKPIAPIGKTPMPPRIGNVTIVPQGRTAYFDQIVGWDLQAKPDFKGIHAIIDIGGRTTDLAYLINGKIEGKNSGSLQIGVLDVISQLNENLMAQTKRLRAFPPRALDHALRQRRINYDGVEIDVSASVDSAISKVAGKLIAEIKGRFVDADVADQIIIVGGGAAVFEPVLRSLYKAAVFPENPNWANVRGFWKLGAISVFT